MEIIKILLINSQLFRDITVVVAVKLFVIYAMILVQQGIYTWKLLERGSNENVFAETTRGNKAKTSPAIACELHVDQGLQKSFTSLVTAKAERLFSIARLHLFPYSLFPRAGIHAYHSLCSNLA